MAVRVAICQPLVPHYRAPLFNRLAALPDVELTVFAGLRDGSLSTAASNEAFDFRADPVKTVHLGPLHFRYQPSQVGVIDPRRFDLAILTWDAHYLSLWPALFRARLRGGPPVVLWGHGVSKRDSRFRRALRNFLGRRADAVLVYSRTVAERLVSEDGFPPERVFVAQNALDQSAIQRARAAWLEPPGRLAEFQGRHGLDPAETLAFVSRLEPDNDIGLLLRAFAAIRARRPAARLAVVGDGSDRRRLESMADELGIADSVIFAGALYREEEIAPWMLSAAVFCYPRNIGLSLLHAFGYGLPVVTGDRLAGHGPEIESLVPGKNGLLYREGDAGHMAEQCQYLMDHPELRDAMAWEALSSVERVYTLDNMAAGFRELLDRFGNGVGYGHG